MKKQEKKYGSLGKSLSLKMDFGAMRFLLIAGKGFKAFIIVVIGK